MGAILCCCGKRDELEDELIGSEQSVSNETTIERNIPRQSIRTNSGAATPSFLRPKTVYIIPEFSYPERPAHPQSVNPTLKNAMLNQANRASYNIFKRQTYDNVPPQTEKFRTFTKTSRRSIIRGEIPGMRSLRCLRHNRNYFVTLPSREDWNEGRVVFPKESMVCYTDGSKIPDTNATGAGVYLENTDIKRSYSLASETTILQAEIFAIQAVTELKRIKEGKEHFVYICCDSERALRALCEVSPKCQLVRKCSEALEELANKKHVILVWVPSHTGIPGNELADKLAKIGSKPQSALRLHKSFRNQSTGNRSKGMYGKTSDYKTSPIANRKANRDRVLQIKGKTNKPFNIYDNNFPITVENPQPNHLPKRTAISKLIAISQNNYPFQREATNSSCFEIKGPQPTLVFNSSQKRLSIKPYSKFMKGSRKTSNWKVINRPTIRTKSFLTANNLRLKL